MLLHHLQGEGVIAGVVQEDCQHLAIGSTQSLLYLQIDKAGSFLRRAADGQFDGGARPQGKPGITSNTKLLRKSVAACRTTWLFQLSDCLVSRTSRCC